MTFFIYRGTRAGAHASDSDVRELATIFPRLGSLSICLLDFKDTTNTSISTLRDASPLLRTLSLHEFVRFYRFHALARVSEHSFYQQPCETVLENPLLWCGQPVLDDVIIGIVSTCRDLVLSYTGISELTVLSIRKHHPKSIRVVTRVCTQPTPGRYVNACPPTPLCRPCQEMTVGMQR
jgi:hypothetical protein